MKNIVTGIIVISTLSFSAHAQVQRNTNDSNKMNQLAKKGDKDWLKDRLNLTSSQKEQMKAINEAFREKLQAVIRNESLTHEQRRAQREALNEEKNNKILAILTSEQKKIFMENRKNPGMDGSWDKPKGEGGMEQMRSALGLTEEQVAKIKTSNGAYLQKERAIYDNQSLTADEKDKQLDNLKKEREQAFRSYLTKEQAAKLEAMKGNGDWKEKRKENGYKEKIKIKNS